MLDIVKNSLDYLFVSMALSAIFVPIMIHFLYMFGQVSGLKKSKIGADDKGDNSLFLRIMNSSKTNGTPNMGGIIIWLVVPIITYIFVPMTPVLQTLLLGFVLLGFWGFLDQAFANAIKENTKLKALQETFEWRMGKLAIAIGINIGVMYMLFNTGALESLSFLNLFTLTITPLMIPVIGFIGQFAVYAAEITDGLDGLMVGIFGIILTAFTGLLILQGQTEFIPVLAIAIGVVLVDLYFNIPPARFWNGGPGAMPLGFLAFFIALVTDNVLPYLAMSSMTWIILASSIIQIISLKFFNKRVFKIAPIHHHFQSIGWPKEKVTMRFWLFTIIASMVGVYLGVI